MYLMLCVMVFFVALICHCTFITACAMTSCMQLRQDTQQRFSSKQRQRSQSRSSEGCSSAYQAPQHRCG